MSLTDYMTGEQLPTNPNDIEARVQKSFIDVNAKIEYPPVAISIGSHTQSGNTYPTIFGTYGNFSAIVGPQKSKKTFLKSLLASAFIGGNSSQFTGNIKNHKTKEMFVLDIDTEQSRWHTQNVAKRTIRLVDEKCEFYKPYGFREFSALERIQNIEYLIYESDFRDNIGLVCIDGIADLVSDFNNLKECFEIVQKVMKWTDNKQFHLLTIIHQNSISSKATGHLGSFISKKAETICNVENKDGAIAVTFPYTRGYAIDGFSFDVNSDGLPYVIGDFPSAQFPIKQITPSESFESETTFAIEQTESPF